MKGWKSRFFFIRFAPPLIFLLILFLPFLPPELPRAYKFEEFYKKSMELVEGQKFISSDLITEDILITHGLSVRVPDPGDRMIDEYGNSDAQPDNLHPYYSFV